MKTPRQCQQWRGVRLGLALLKSEPQPDRAPGMLLIPERIGEFRPTPHPVLRVRRTDVDSK